MQFDVYRNTEPGDRVAPYLVDIQANLLSGLATRLVVPLVPKNVFGPRIQRLHPVLRVADADFVLATQLLAAIDRRRVRAAIGSLVDDRDTIIDAVDVLLAGV